MFELRSLTRLHASSDVGRGKLQAKKNYGDDHSGEHGTLPETREKETSLHRCYVGDCLFQGVAVQPRLER